MSTFINFRTNSYHFNQFDILNMYALFGTILGLIYE